MYEVRRTSKLAAAPFARRKSLVAGIAALFAIAPSAQADVKLVTSCTDAGPGDSGNLRNTIAIAADGDTVDVLTFTGCPTSKITLLLGQIAIPQNDLTLLGPAQGPPLNIAPLTIDGLGNAPNGMFRHSGTGTLSIYNLTLAHGTITNNTQPAKGGCVYSAGSVTTKNVNVTHCIANTVSGKAYGGGIYAKNLLNIKYTTLSQNSASAGNGGTAEGGGFFAKGGAILNYSAISGNSQTSTQAYGGCCGGGYVGAATSVQSSTISGNTAQRTGGLGVFAKTSSLALRSSTVSGNTATVGPIGGISAYTAYANVYYSTIAFNSAAKANFGAATTYSAGLAVRYAYLSMSNSILAGNSVVAAAQNDLTLTNMAALRNVRNNLVQTSAVTLPADTIVNQCPRLGKLRNNGGLTQTRALLSHSPAIDKGVLVLGPNEDQRGKPTDLNPPYPFPRTSGTAIDIGAYEVQQNDIVFNDSFDGCN